MIRKIIKKEIYENIISLRFILAFLLIVSTFSMSGFVYINRYSQEIYDYRQQTNKNLSVLREQTDNLGKVAFHDQTIFRKPKVLELCAEGYEKFLPNRFTLNVFTIRYPELKTHSNFLLSRFSDIDWVFIVSYILSFVALVLTFDCVSREKENRTLRLVLSNSVPRDTLLLAKYAGALLTLGIPLLLGLLVNLIVVSTSPLVSITGDDWLKIIAIFVGSLLYLSIFVLLGIIISSKSTKSSASIVCLLLLWVFWVAIVPSCGRIVSEKYHKIPTWTEVEKRIEKVRGQIWEERTRSPSIAGISPAPGGNWVPRAEMRNEMTETRNKIFDHYIQQMTAQVNLGRNFTRLSPATVYQCFAEEIVGTGVARFKNLYSQIKKYKEVLKTFVLNKDKDDTESIHLLFDEWYKIGISQKPVDFNIIPKFKEEDLSLSTSLRQAIWDLVLLVILNVVLFVVAYVAFLRYDVR